MHSSISPRLVLVADPRPAAPASAVGAPVRRYRLARLRATELAPAENDRFAYLRRGHD
jgi:hypothetical protein